LIQITFLNLTIEDSLRILTFVPVLLYFSFKKERNKARQVLFYFFLFISLHSLLYALITFFSNQIGIIFNSLYVPIEFIFISIFYYNARNSVLYKQFIRYVSIVFLLLFSLKIVLDPILDFDSLINGIESIIIIAFSISFFYEHIKNPNSTFIDKDPYFWGVSAFFLFFSISFFVFLLRQSYWHNNDFFYQYVYIHALSGILRNIICSIAFLIKPYKDQVPEFS
jgi:hypothetical protein